MIETWWVRYKRLLYDGETNSSRYGMHSGVAGIVNQEGAQPKQNIIDSLTCHSVAGM